MTNGIPIVLMVLGRFVFLSILDSAMALFCGKGIGDTVAAAEVVLFLVRGGRGNYVCGAK